MWYIIFAILTLVSLYGLYLLFVKAGRKGWEAVIPFYKDYVTAQLVGRPTWWVVLLVVPIVNVFIFYGLYLDFVKSFGKRRFWENAAAVLVPFIVLPLWGRDSNVKYLGVTNSEEFRKKYPYKKSVAREWADAIIFATVAASLIRGFLIEAYMIPTGSMERSLLVGDFLFVSKLNYGPRIPNTPIAFPFAHHTMPLTGGKAYSEAIKLDYNRLPGFEIIERNDVVVFNYPVEVFRPVDKRENYIKRAVGVPGDIVEMKQGNLIVNGQPGYDSDDVQKAYMVFTDGSGLNQQVLKDKRMEYIQQYDENGSIVYILFVTKDEIKEVENWTNVSKVIMSDNPNHAFPKSELYDSDLYNWDFHNFGPLTIPAKGDVIELNESTLPIYETLITVYEGNTLEHKTDGIYINGVKADRYEIKMNYYWMMGDNRDNSLDSRDFGFVPEDHVVGKALFTWFSWDADGSFLSKVRWNRIFRGIK